MKSSRERWVVALLVVLLQGVPNRVHGDELSSARGTLRGLAGVQAEVVDIDQTALAGKVLTGDLQARLERRLRDAHVRVLGDDDQQSTGLAPSLTLDLTPVRVNAGEQQLGWAVYIEVSVSQYVSLIRPKPASGAVVLATTWNSGRIAVLKDDETFLDRLLEKVDAECDIFINAWQATHPTRSPRQP